MYIGFHVKYMLFLSDIKEIRIFSADFWKILKYQISWKSIQREPSCSTWTARQMDMTKTIDAFRNFANVPNKGTAQYTQVTVTHKITLEIHNELPLI
jgi:hypothetical protein